MQTNLCLQVQAVDWKQSALETYIDSIYLIYLSICLSISIYIFISIKDNCSHKVNNSKLYFLIVHIYIGIFWVASTLTDFVITRTTLSSPSLFSLIISLSVCLPFSLLQCSLAFFLPLPSSASLYFSLNIFRILFWPSIYMASDNFIFFDFFIQMWFDLMLQEGIFIWCDDLFDNSEFLYKSI